jgi:outer membrane protein TolC
MSTRRSVGARQALLRFPLTLRTLGAVGALAALPACRTPERYAAEADFEVATLLAETDAATLSDRPERVLQPKAAAAGTEAPADAAAAPVDEQAGASGAEPLLLDLPAALEIAVTTGRDFLNQRESLYLQGLGLTLTRYNFGPLLNSTVGYLWNDAKDQGATGRAAWDLGLTQILPTGGSFSIGGVMAATHAGGGADEGSDPTFDSNLDLGLTQPLLRGSGYEVSHEALTQGERSIVYAVRDFELFREDFSIGIARDFFDLVSQKQRLANLEQNWRDAQFDQTKAEALRQVDRNQDEDVFLARRRVINAETDLLSARTSYEAAVDAFKLQLGLSSSVPVVIADREPPFEPVALDPDSAVEVALHNRLDLLTAAEQLEDSERAVRIARNGLQADLDLTARYGLSGSQDDVVSAFPEDPSATVGLALSLPINRQSERNGYRSSLISLDRARRDYTLLTDNTERDIKDQLRQLDRVAQQIELQRQQIEQEQRAVAVTEIRYEAGDVDNRDLLDARQSLVDAQNALIDLKADHFIARLTLLRDMGLLFIDSKGMWTS